MRSVGSKPPGRGPTLAVSGLFVYLLPSLLFCSGVLTHSRQGLLLTLRPHPSITIPATFLFIFILWLKKFPLGILALKYLKCWLQSQWNCAKHTSEDNRGSFWQRTKSRSINSHRVGCLREAELVLCCTGRRKPYTETKTSDFNLIGNDSHGTGAPWHSASAVGLLTGPASVDAERGPGASGSRPLLDFM